MYLDHRIIIKIARILNMVDSNALLLDQNGNVILPEGDTRVLNLPEEIKKNPTKPLVYGAVVLIGTSDENPVYINLPGNSEEIMKCAVLCAELINNILRENMTQTSKDQSLRLMLRGEVEPSEYEALAVEHDIPQKKERCVMYFYVQDIASEDAIYMMQDTLDANDDLLTEVGRHSIALLKSIPEGEGIEELVEYAHAIETSFKEETGKEVIIGISEMHEDINEIADAFQEARSAINVGRSYHSGRVVFVYRNLLLERFLNEITPEMSADFNVRIFNKKTAKLFNEEMIHTIETFFDNSLNLSETARKLYIHRNTLVYRLEKVQKAIGLDLRNFDDAVTFKMMMLLGKNVGGRKFRL